MVQAVLTFATVTAGVLTSASLVWGEECIDKMIN